MDHKSVESQSGQIMIPLLLTVGSILLMWTLSSQGLNNSAVVQKDASVAAEADAFATSVSSVLSVPSSCSAIIQYGDGGVPLTFDIIQNPVVTFSYGLYYPTSSTLLSSALGFISTGVYSNTVTIPNVSSPTSTLRIDPTNFINYGLQTSGPFANLNCYQVNLHVEPQYPSSTTGMQTVLMDFPIQIGVNPTTHVISQCAGGTGTFCSMAIPTLVPSPMPSCWQAGNHLALNWTASNTSYVKIDGPTPTTAPSTGPAYVTLPPTPGIYTYYAMPMDGTYQNAPSPYPSWVFTIPPTPDFYSYSISSSGGTATASWITENAASVTISPTPAPGPTSYLSPAGTQTWYDVGPTTYTFTAYPLCGATPTATATFNYPP